MHFLLFANFRGDVLASCRVSLKQNVMQL